MTVRDILDRKGGDVHTLSADETLLNAVQALADHKVGALVVSNADKAILGILSERDIVRAISRVGPACLEDRVDSVMTRAVRTCVETTTISELMSEMTDGRFRHMPVERDGKLIGIVSIGDVVKKRIADIEREAEDIKAYIAAV